MTSSEPSPRTTWSERLSSLISSPRRLFEERISIQLIVSYVAVVLLVIVLFEATVLGSILWSPDNVLPEEATSTIDPYLGERTTAYAHWLQPGRVIDVMSDEPLDRARVEALNDQLRKIAEGDVPGFNAVSPVSKPTDETIAMVVRSDGIVIASSNPTYRTLSDLETLPDDLSAAIVTNQRLGGRVDPSFNALYNVRISNDHTIATYPLLDEDGDHRGTLLVQGEAVKPLLEQSRGDYFQRMLLILLQSIWIFAIPAVIVAVPFGIWRAAAMSRRLERLAGAAESMAQGNMNTRVAIRRHDEIGRLAESFNAMAERIDEDDRARRAFISNISHELRTPVSIILGNVERLQSHPDTRDEQVAKPLDVIEHEGVMLSRLIDDLFTVSRYEEHSLKLVAAPVQVDEVVAEVLQGVQSTAWSERKISVESLVPPTTPPVQADAQRLKQIISNLVYNALRHTPEGGLVIVQAEPDATTVAISVSDTGMGMDEETRSRVFSRYYQSERSRRHAEGSGLGLAIVETLVTAHGGTIEVESAPGQGTTFRFTLPRVTSA